MRKRDINKLKRGDFLNYKGRFFMVRGNQKFGVDLLDLSSMGHIFAGDETDIMRKAKKVGVVMTAFLRLRHGR
jgi:hypothetical protein